jgi:hypothetical protein
VLQHASNDACKQEPHYPACYYTIRVRTNRSVSQDPLRPRIRRSRPYILFNSGDGIEEFRHDVEQHIVPVLGSRPLAEVAAPEVAALLEQVRMTAPPAAVRQLRSTLQELSNDAVVDGLLPRIPLDG